MAFTSHIPEQEMLQHETRKINLKIYLLNRMRSVLTMRREIGEFEVEERKILNEEHDIVKVQLRATSK